MQKSLRALAGLVLVGLAIWGWRVLFPSPEKVIRARLADLVQTISFPPTEAPLTKLAEARKAMSFFTSDVVITAEVPRAGRRTLRGVDNLFQAYAGVRQSLNGLTVEFLDIRVTLGPDKTTATVNMTVRAAIPGQEDFYVEEMNLLFKKVDGEWLIHVVEPVKTFTRVRRAHSVVILAES